MALGSSILGNMGNDRGRGRDDYDDDYDDLEPATYDGYQITQLHLIETGTYTPEFIRSYMLSATRDDLDTISDLVGEKGSNILSASDLSGTASGMLTYSSKVSKQDLVEIDGGWDTKRLSFMIEVVEAAATEFERRNKQIVTLITGYTDRMDFHKRSITRGRNSHSDYVLPDDLEFFVTNVHRIERDSLQILGDFQIIAPARYNNYSRDSRSGRNNQLYTLRPRDIVTNEYTLERSRSIRDKGNTSLISINGTNTVRGVNPQTSRTSNIVPVNYLSSVLNASVKAEESLGGNVRGFDSFGNRVDRAGDVLAQSASYLREEPFFQNNSFMTLMRRKSNSFSTRTMFTWGELNDIFTPSEIDRIAKLHVRGVLSEQRRGRTSRYSDASDVAEWDNNEDMGRNAMFATAIKQALPGMALECAIYACRIEATNYVGRGTRYEVVNGIDITISDIVFATKLPPAKQQEYRDSLERLVADSLLYDLSLRNRITFDIIVELDWRNDTFIDVSIEGGKMVNYSTAAYANSLTSPILTLDADRTDSFGSAIRELVGNILGSKR